MLGQTALQKQGALVGVEARGQPVDDHFEHIFFDHFAVFVVRGQRMPVGYKKVAIVGRLQAHPVFQGAVVVAQMQSAGGTHAR